MRNKDKNEFIFVIYNSNSNYSPPFATYQKTSSTLEKGSSNRFPDCWDRTRQSIFRIKRAILMTDSPSLAQAAWTGFACGT